MTDDLDKIDEFVLGNTQAQYSPLFIEHSLHPRNVGNCDEANGSACLTAHDGSAMEIWLRVDDDIVTDISFWTEGCGTTIACGSMLTEMVKNKNLGQAFEITPEDIEAALGGLPGEGCTCAKLVMDTLKAALRDYLTFKSEPWRRKYSRH